MSKFTPWTDEEADQAAHANALSYGYGSLYHEKHKVFEKGFLAGVTWAAAQIEKCETVHGGENNMGTLSWSPSKMNGDTHIAKLVGVREVSHE